MLEYRRRNRVENIFAKMYNKSEIVRFYSPSILKAEILGMVERSWGLEFPGPWH